jgi:hypothetical protein
MTTVERLNELTKRVAKHLSGGRDVEIVWRNPPSSTAAGQCFKTADGKVLIFVGELTSPDTHLRVLLHELSHARHDYDILPIYNPTRKAIRTKPKTKAQRDKWGKNPRELRAQAWEDYWFQYADDNRHEYFTGYQSSMECRLLALLEWQPKLTGKEVRGFTSIWKGALK